MLATRLRKHQSGVMLLEALIAILIFSLGVLGVVGMQASAIAASRDAKYRTDAALLANEIIGQTRNIQLHWFELDPPRFDLGQIQQVIDDIEQMLARRFVGSIGWIAKATGQDRATGNDANNGGIHSKLSCHSHENPSSKSRSDDRPAPPWPKNPPNFRQRFTGGSFKEQLTR